MPTSQWHGKSDAAADATSAGIGGWLSDQSEPTKDQVWWFMLPVSRTEHKWAFSKGKPQRLIAALELYGSLILLKAIIKKAKSHIVNFRIPFATDNQGNAFNLLNSTTRSWPCSAILMELVTLTELSETCIAPSHVKREGNIWADQLSNLDSTGFDVSRRLTCDALEDWSLLPELLELHSSEQEGTVP